MIRDNNSSPESRRLNQENNQLHHRNRDEDRSREHEEARYLPSHPQDRETQRINHENDLYERQSA